VTKELDLTDIAIAALIASPISMVMAIVIPQYAWLLGAVLIVLGVATVVHALTDYQDAEAYVVGIMVAIFGLLTEVATVEGLAYLTVFAILVDAIVGTIQHYA
jgi:cytochrome c biogenesis protein CcdA